MGCVVLFLYLMYNFNISLFRQSFLSFSAYVPIFLKDNTVLLANYRPISIFNNLCKISQFV